MGIKVCKFGGSSLADAAHFQRVRDILLSDPQRRFVVASAPGKRDKADEKVTDLLYQCYRAVERKQPAEEIFARVAGRYMDIANALGLENGMQKKVTEPYLVDALSFTEAEARIIEEVSPFISGEFSVSAVKRANFSELFFDETGDRWYKCKLNFITLDEKSGMEKRTASYMLVQAADFETALKNLVEGMKGTMADWVIVSITETPLMDVYPFDPERKTKEEDRPQE